MSTRSLPNCRVTAVAWAIACSAPALADSDPASLSRLHDIVVPGAVPWWPPAPGWYALGFIVAATGGHLAWRYHRRRQLRRYRVAALETLQAFPLTGDNDLNYAAEVMSLLRRTALAAWPRAEIVPLQGGAWWQFLDAQVDRPAFAAELGPLCERLAYAPGHDESQSTEQLMCLRDAAAYWIEAHRAPSPRSVLAAT